MFLCLVEAQLSAVLHIAATVTLSVVVAILAAGYHVQCVTGAVSVYKRRGTEVPERLNETCI